ncbi:MAG TPA: arsenate reductase ArsC [Gaiellaceae bacterium]
MRYVLFVCTHNAGRSQMAQAFFERYAPEDFRAESAGQEPAEAIWPAVVEAMREVGIDISVRRPKKLDLEMQLHADWAITLACGGACPYVPATVEDWEVADPAGRPLVEVRTIRAELEARVKEFVETRLDDVRRDKTAHALRLEKLLRPLAEEFEDEKAPEEIRACADAILSRYAEVPVRSMVLTIALKQTRECLREPTCSVLA